MINWSKHPVLQLEGKQEVTAMMVCDGFILCQIYLSKMKNLLFPWTYLVFHYIQNTYT